LDVEGGLNVEIEYKFDTHKYESKREIIHDLWTCTFKRNRMGLHVLYRKDSKERGEFGLRKKELRTTRARGGAQKEAIPESWRGREIKRLR